MIRRAKDHLLALNFKYPFDSNKAQKTIAKTGLVVAGAAAVLIPSIRGNLILENILLATLGLGFIVGIFAFIMGGIQQAGKETGKTNLIASVLHVLKKTFLYILLPAIVLSAMLIIWAITTQQPAFR